MGVFDAVRRKLSEMFSVEGDETVVYEYSCAECGTTFSTRDPPEEAACESCGSADLEEERRMFTGGSGVDTV